MTDETNLDLETYLDDAAAMPDEDFDRNKDNLAKNAGVSADELEELVKPRRAQNVLNGITLTDENGKNKSQGTLLIEIGRRVQMFHDENGTYAQLYINDHFEIHDLKSTSYREWLSSRYFQLTNKAAYGMGIRDAVETLKHYARHEGMSKQMFLRTCVYDDEIFIDLTNDKFEQLKITKNGHEVIAGDSNFVRRGKPQPLPYPEESDLNLLWDFINVNDENDKILLVGWLLASLYPTGPYPVLVLQGEQGSCKPSATRMLRSLVDPNYIPLSGSPKDKKDLITEAHNNWVVALDNLSSLPDEISDALCRLSTGGGIKVRRLYTDIEEMSVNLQRPVIINSIKEIVTRGDLIERSIFVELNAVSDSARKTERKLWHEFEAAKPKIFGALVNGLTMALRNLSSTELDKTPRMADFALLVTSAETALGLKPGSFMEAYWRRHSNAAHAALESSLFGTALIQFINGRKSDGFRGTATELLDVLELMMQFDQKKPQGWPNNPRNLSDRLRDIAPHLRKIGIEVEWLPRTNKRREFSIFFREEDLPSSQSPSSPHDENDSGDDNDDDIPF